MTLSLERETDIQRAVVLRYRELGCQVYITSRRRTSHASATKGVPDLYVLHAKGAWWHESKTPSGTLSLAQRLFASDCKRAGVPYVLGGVEAALAHLKRIGLVRS